MRGQWLFAAASCALISSVPPATAQTVQSITDGTTLVTVNASAPGTVLSSVAISGIAAGTTIGGIDYRPASPRTLYAISNVGQVYAINARTGVATAVGTPASPTISGIGFDFNPTVDRIRVVTQTRQDFRVVPDTGALAVFDGTLTYAATDPRATAIPNVAGAAYTNPVAGATSTTLYVIDTNGALAPATLATQGNATVSPNTGTLFTVGSTGVTTIGNVGFDISRNGTALATFTDPTTRQTSLYSVNLTTGAATLIGKLAGSKLYEGLAIALDSFASMGATVNQAAVGAQIDMFTGVPTGDTARLINGIDSLYATPGAQAAALSQLSPGAYSSLPDLSLNAVEVSETNVLRYARDLRGQKTMADGTTATLDDAGRVGAWLVGGARFGHFNADVDRPRATSDEVHVLGGLDFRFAPATAIGVFGGYSDTDARLSPGSQQSKLKSLFGGVYGTASVGPAYVDAWGSYTDLDWDLTRSIAFGGFSAQPTAHTGGRVWAAGASTGLSFDFGGFGIEPYAAVRYANVRVDAFGEQGGSAAALNVGQQKRESLRGNFGARIGYEAKVSSALVRIEGRGGYYREFMNDRELITTSFQNAGLGTTPFAFQATRLDRDYYNAGATLGVSGNGPLSIIADYDAQFDHDRRYSTMTVGARFAF